MAGKSANRDAKEDTAAYDRRHDPPLLSHPISIGALDTGFRRRRP